MKTLTTQIIKVTLTSLLYLQNFHSSANANFINYRSSNDKIELAVSNKVDSTNISPEQENKTVDLLSTSIRQENNYVKILWESEMEVDNRFYTIEKSLDAQNWEETKIVDGAGTSSTHQSYSFIDKTPFYGISYYRIKYTDFNGNYGYSRVEAINFISNSIQVQMYPQPAEDFVTLVLSGFTEENIELTILSSDGLIIKRTTQEFSGNQLNVSDLNSGVYFIHLKTAEQSKVFRMIKK